MGRTLGAKFGASDSTDELSGGIESGYEPYVGAWFDTAKTRVFASFQIFNQLKSISKYGRNTDVSRRNYRCHQSLYP